MDKSIEQSALLFIPDITGFTQFVNDREIKHTHNIIAELLEILIESNRLNLTVNEIEGDAILFYRLGECPSINDIVEQSKVMYVAFHRHLKKYGISRICNCAACRSAGRLTLKTIVHFGSISLLKIQDRQKLFGPDVIKVHRLLKNNVDLDEYILLSEKLGDRVLGTNPEENWVTWKRGFISYDVGDMNYAYTSLQPVYAHVPEPELEQVKVYRSGSPLIFYFEINAPIEVVYEALIDINKRPEWMSGIKAIRIRDEPLNRMNKLCTSFECTLEHEKCTFQTNNAQFDEHSLRLSETVFEHRMTLNYFIEEMDNKAKLTLECHVSFNWPMNWLFSFLMKKKFKAQIQRSMERLKHYCEKRRELVFEK